MVFRMCDGIPRFRGPGSPPVEEYGVERREVVRDHVIILNTLNHPVLRPPLQRRGTLPAQFLLTLSANHLLYNIEFHFGGGTVCVGYT